MDTLYTYFMLNFALPRFQGIPTVLGGSAIGYVVGKMTYKSKMEDRFLAELPYSNIARQIRIKRKLELPG